MLPTLRPKYQHNVKIWKIIRTLEVEIFEIVKEKIDSSKSLRKVRLLLGGRMRVERKGGKTRRGESACNRVK